MNARYFTGEVFTFLKQLSRNNRRDWFQSHQARYERAVREPALRLVADLAEPLRELSPHMVAFPSKSGGSLYRIQRDGRYASGKPPYKTWLGIRLYHERRREQPAPLFYLHIQPDHCFVAGGLWRPEPPSLKRVREFILDNPDAWRRAAHHPALLRDFEPGGERLTRPPRGFPADHPLVEDLKRKDFLALHHFDPRQALEPGFDRFVMTRVRQLAPLVDYLCAALELDF